MCAGSEVEGGSTITQQLARLRYLSPERTLRRKVQEAMIALWLEARLSKDEILARYLNSRLFRRRRCRRGCRGAAVFRKTA